MKEGTGVCGCAGALVFLLLTFPDPIRIELGMSGQRCAG